MIAPNEHLGGGPQDPAPETVKFPPWPFHMLNGIVCSVDEKRPLDSANHLGVSCQGEQFGIMKMPVRWLARDEAINLAAWLVNIADPERKEFERVLNEIQKT